MAEKEKKQIAKSETKTNEIPVEYRLEKSFEEVAKLLPQRREEAIREGAWKEIRLHEYSGYLLEVSIAPDGNPALKVVSPGLKNNFAIMNAEIFHVFVHMAKVLELNRETVMNIIGLCNRYNTRQRKYKKRDIV
jgi:hypothetical protein